jgi:hypothetical protein
MSDEKELVSPFRIAFREEGKVVNVYFARQGTMEGAFLMGSIMRSILNVHPDQFVAFRKIFENGMRECIKDVMGVDVAEFQTGPAPENERAGHS